MKIGIQTLRAKVRGFQAEGSSIQRRISSSTGLTRQLLWTRKRELGSEQRYHLLAYGLLRGFSYKQLESNTRTPIDPKKLLEVIKTHERYRKITQEGRTRYVEWNLEDVSGLLKTETESA